MYHQKSIDEVLKNLSTTTGGLSQKEVDRKIESYGYNELDEKEKDPLWKLFLENFKDPLVIILLVAAGIQIFLGEVIESTIILLVIILNAVLGVAQTKKAAGSLTSLKKLSTPNAKVMREKKKITINSKDLVPGDIVLIEAGDYIPADGRLIESQTLKVIEGMLTGESEPVLKNDEIITGEVALGDQLNMVFSGSLVVYGRAIYVVTSTGMNTEVGKIANLIDNVDNKQTPLQTKLEEFSKKLGIGIVILSAIIFLIQVLRGANIINSFMFAIAIAVAAIPEALSSIVTIVLAVGTNIMAKKQAIIRKLPVVETLGSTSVICTDKTGTLTQNKMTVVDIFMNGIKTDCKKEKVKPIELEIKDNISQTSLLALSTVLCNDSDITSEGQEIGDPTEIALINLALKNNIDYKKIRKTYTRLEELPFDSDRKLMSTYNKVDNNVLMFTKGAPDVIFNRCKYALVNGNISSINNDIINSYKSMNEQFSNEALRVLAFAYKEKNNEKLEPSIDDEQNLILIGILAMIDPPREEVYEAVRNAKDSGIKPIMITGDHKTTAAAIAKEIGIMKDGDLALTGKELDSLSDYELDNKLDKISVYARVSPENKIRIVNSWQKKGKITAMTGDGVNDAPALKQANIGIGMGSGTEVAKDASAMILLDDNFATIMKAVEVGRTVYTNIKKSITYLFSGNLGGIIAILFAVSANWINPFTTLQLLFINLVTDSLPAIALGLEQPEKDVMNNLPRDPKESILSKDILQKVIFRGTLIGIVTIIAQYIGLKYSNELAIAMAFSTLTLSRILQTFAARSNSESIFKIGFTSNKVALGAVIICLTMFLLTLIPGIRHIFNIPLTYNIYNFTICLGLAIVSTIIMDLSKLIKLK